MPSLLFEFVGETRIIQSQYAGGMLLPPVQTLVATLIFAFWQKCKRVSPLGQSKMKMADNSPLTRRSVKQRSVGSTHVNMPSTAVTDAPHIKIIPYTTHRVNKVTVKQSLSQLR